MNRQVNGQTKDEIITDLVIIEAADNGIKRKDKERAKEKGKIIMRGKGDEDKTVLEREG